MVIEFCGTFPTGLLISLVSDAQAAYGFVQTLKPDDYVAVVAYDMRPEILSDFSTDRRETQEALQRLRFPGFSEANLFDALTDTAQRMQDIEGRKAILLISSGVDTFSKLNYGKTRKAIQNAGVPIYAIGLMQAYREIMYPMEPSRTTQNMTSCRPTTKCAPSPRKPAAWRSSRASMASSPTSTEESARLSAASTC